MIAYIAIGCEIGRKRRNNDAALCESGNILIIPIGKTRIPGKIRLRTVKSAKPKRIDQIAEN